MFDVLIRQGTVSSIADQSSDRASHPTRTDRVADIAIESGHIVQIAARIEGSARQVIDAAGRYVSPPFVESHIHLDSAMTAGNPRWNQSGTLFEGIEIWREFKQNLTLEDVKTRAIEIGRAHV